MTALFFIRINRVLGDLRYILSPQGLMRQQRFIVLCLLFSLQLNRRKRVWASHHVLHVLRLRVFVIASGLYIAVCVDGCFANVFTGDFRLSEEAISFVPKQLQSNATLTESTIFSKHKVCRWP